MQGVSVLQNYRILEQLSASENADVYLVLGEDRRVYVMKKIKKGDILAYELLLGKEYKNLARVTDVDEENGIAVMEYVQGTSLEDMCGRCDADRMRGFALQLCDALYALHENALVHRDIKPSNIIINDDGVLKLIDFDTARVYKKYAGKDTKYIGTESFASPEQYGFAQTDTRSDIYACGALIYYILSDGESPDTHSEYKGELHEVIDKCMSIDPKDRYQTVDEFRNALLGKNEKPSAQTVSSKKLSAFKLIGVIILSLCIQFVIVNFAMEFFDTAPQTAQGTQSKDEDIGVVLDTSSYTADTYPIELSSWRIKKEKVTLDYAPVIYAKIENKDKETAYNVILTFELFDKDGISLGQDKKTELLNAEQADVFDFQIFAYGSYEGDFKRNNGIVRTIRLVDARCEPA